MADKRVHREPLDESWASALVGKDVWEEFLDAHARLNDCVSRIRERVQNNPLSDVVAREAARQSKRRGDPTLVVDDQGTVFLEVVYSNTSSKTEGGIPAPEAPTSSKRDWNSDLPSLSVLRAQAEAVGLDPTPFGRRKRELLDAIPARQNGSSPGRPKMRKTAPAVGPVTVINSETSDLPS